MASVDSSLRLFSQKGFSIPSLDTGNRVVYVTGNRASPDPAFIAIRHPCAEAATFWKTRPLSGRDLSLSIHDFHEPMHFSIY